MKRKIYFCLLVFLFLILFFMPKSKAFQEIIVNDITYKLPDFDFSTLEDRPFFIDYESESGWIEICVPRISSANEYIFYVTQSNTRVMYLADGTMGNWDTYYVRNGFNDTFTYYAGNNMANISLSRPVIYSSLDIYCENKSDVFFLKAPLLRPPAVVARAVLKVGQVEMRAVLQEILAMFPVILSVLVFLLAFSKGLKILLTFLVKS